MLIIRRKNYHIKYRQRSRTHKSRSKFETDWRMVRNSCAASFFWLSQVWRHWNQTKPKPYAKCFCAFFLSFYSRLFVVKNVQKNSHTDISAFTYARCSVVRLFIELSLKICFQTWYWSLYFLPFHLLFVFVLRFHLIFFCCCLNYWKVLYDIFKCELNKQRKKSRTI